MTADEFTEAARAEAEDYARTPRMNVGTVRDRIAVAHLTGAELARTHLAGQMKQRVAAANQDRNKALERARKAEGLLRNVVDHLAAQEESDTEVEAAARALYAEDVNESYTEWPAYDSPENVGRELYIERARNALSAARDARRDEETW